MGFSINTDVANTSILLRKNELLEMNNVRKLHHGCYRTYQDGIVRYWKKQVQKVPRSKRQVLTGYWINYESRKLLFI